MKQQSVQLKGMAKFTHFSPLIFVLLFPVIGLIFLFNNPQDLHKPESIDLELLDVIPVPIAVFLFWHLKRLLRFKLVHTTHSAEENYQAVVSLAHKLGWNIKIQRPSEFIQASAGGFPQTLLSWGEQVTVRFLKSDIYVNSICDPNERSSLSSWGRNSGNVQSVLKAVSEAGSLVQDNERQADAATIAQQEAESTATIERNMHFGRIGGIVGVILIAVVLFVPAQPGASPGSKFYLLSAAITLISVGWLKSRPMKTSEKHRKTKMIKD